MLMLNQVPRSLLSVGAAHSYTFDGLRAGYMNGIEAGSGGGRHPHSLVTPRQSGSGKIYGSSFRNEDAVLPPAPPSLGRKRVSSIERASRRRSTGMSGKSFTTAVLEEFTNESFAEQAIRDFGGNVRPRSWLRPEGSDSRQSWRLYPVGIRRARSLVG